MSSDSRQDAIVRQLIYSLADCDGDVDLAEAAERVKKKFENRGNDIAEIKDAVPTDLEALTYEQMDKHQRVSKLRRHLLKEARSSDNGKTSVNYKQVKWFFENKPSDGYCYELMEIAADDDGFSYNKFDDDRSNRLEVDPSSVKTSGSFHTVNNGSGVEGD